MMKYVIAGASLFIGADSGPSNIAVAQNIPSIILFGSVDPGRIHVDMHNIGVVTGDCDKSGCWHNNGSTTGQICHYKGTDNYLQCCNHNTAHILMHIENLLKNENG
jgi:ADP-heptose:LPS heptosyltransferase